MVAILDTTLREGEQTPGVCFPSHAKLAIAEALDALGVDYIEAGHPVVSAEIADAVRVLATRGYNAAVVAHARANLDDVQIALDCRVQFIGIFYCVTDERLRDVLKTGLSGAIDRVVKAIAWVKAQDPDVIVRFTPEDTLRSTFENVVTVAVQAARAGADIISIADTAGSAVPGTSSNLYDYVRDLRAALHRHKVAPQLAVHCHNDRGMALANALDAYRAGVDIIDATVMGLGERAGIVDLAQLLAVLAADFGEGQRHLEHLPRIYRMVSEFSNRPIPGNAPIVGANAFTHRAGRKVRNTDTSVATSTGAAATVDPAEFHSLDPALFGRRNALVLDHMAGPSSLRDCLERADLDTIYAPAILDQIRDLGRQGRVVTPDHLEHIVKWYETSAESSCVARNGLRVACDFEVQVGPDRAVFGQATSISKFGISLSLDAELHCGSLVSLVIVSGSDRYGVRGRVVWMSSSNGVREYGVHFVFASPAERVSISNHMGRLLRAT
ncbi:MAG: PilZ domain-containing protein [Proteobacteria bacterium]|nr:PilZ domain-containing protein [Pseudomonadota bacterium]